MKPVILLILLCISIVILNAYTINETFETINEIKKKKAGEDFYKTGKVMGPDDLSDEMKEKTDYTKALNDYDVQYHNTPEQIAKESKINLDTNITWVYDTVKNEKIAMQTPAVQGSYIYYELGKPGYEYGGATYVPNYEESVLLSSSNEYLK
tara:strand:+ start:496 stop:951 length:456 start_codon:yes stop_codon:yes gene_type:complete